MEGIFITIFVVVVIVLSVGLILFSQYRRTLREAKNYERGLKMIPMYIHIPPETDDVDGGARDERDLNEEIISKAQVLYNIIASTATKGFKSRIYGQRHISFEIVAHEGLVHYYTVVPFVMVEVVRQAISAAYPSARLEEVEERNIFSRSGRMTGTVGGEFTLKKEFVYPIAVYQESKQDATRAMLNAFAAATREDGMALQLLLRPARDDWTGPSIKKVEQMKKDKSGKGSGSFHQINGMLEALWKPPEGGVGDTNPGDRKELTALEQAEIEAIEEKTKHPGYEVLIRVVVSSNTSMRAQGLLKNIVAAFSLFNSPTLNGFSFAPARNIDDLVTSYIFRFFPQALARNVLNTVELATIFHLPTRSSIPSSQVKRQMLKQVDGPTQVMDEGFLLGYNEFRGMKKHIRLSENDRRRHIYIIGQTGTGKSVMLENLAYQDMMDGRGLAFIDPHGDSAEALLGKVPKDRVEDVIYFNPGDMANPIGLNMFEFDSEDQKDFLVQEGINMLYGLYDPGHTGIVGPRLEHIFRNCALLLMADPAGGTFIDIPRLLVDESFRSSKLKFAKDRQVIDFWTKEFPASQRSNDAGDLISWVVSKFGPFISNDAMRNIIGQTKSGFDLKEVMNGRKILLVNLSKGTMGELNSKLLGIIFVMKFQAAAMARASIPEKERIDFSLYVDEFQNFATESFESILSEARKYRLSLVLGNQFMTQLTDKIREAIIGNVGTVVSGRIGITDAEILEKKFRPTFEAEDLAKLPNYQSITSVMINNVPSAPFSMAFVPPIGEPNSQLADALKRLSAAKYGRPRAVTEAEINKRLWPENDKPPISARAGSHPGQTPAAGARPPAKSGESFLDDWLAKRQQLGGGQKSASPSSTQAAKPQPAKPQPTASVAQPATVDTPGPQPTTAPAPTAPSLDSKPAAEPQAAPAAAQTPPKSSQPQPSDKPQADTLEPPPVLPKPVAFGSASKQSAPQAPSDPTRLDLRKARGAQPVSPAVDEAEATFRVR